MKINKSPLVSVVVTTKNEEKNIGFCLDSVLNQTYPRRYIETIVVDNKSLDRTVQIAKKRRATVYTHGNERSEQRNFGAKKSHGSYYIYIDADMRLNKKVLAQCVSRLEKDRLLVAVYIPEIIMGTGYWSKVRRFERSFYNGTVVDCVRFVRMSAFKKVKGFDVSMTGPEDWDFDKKIRLLGKTTIINAPLYHNETHFSIWNYFKKKKYYAKSFNQYIKKWGSQDKDVKKQFSIFYRFFGVFFEENKWKRVLKSIHLFAGVMILRLLVGLSYLFQKIKIK